MRKKKFMFILETMSPNIKTWVSPYFVLPFCRFVILFPLGLLKQSDFGSELC